MPIWQFAVFAVLVGALLACVSVLISKLGITNAALKRIEEALLTGDRRGEVQAPTTAAAAAAVTVASEITVVSQTTAEVETTAAPTPTAVVTETTVEVVASPEVPIKAEGAAYLTIRDLRVISGSPRFDTDWEPESLVNADVVAVNSQNSELPGTSEEPRSSVAEGLESQDPTHATTEQPAPLIAEPPAAATISLEREELAEAKNREALLVMMHQRRRRRARAGH